MMISVDVSTDAMVSANPQAVACDLEGEAVILHLETGVYFGLNPVASDIWHYVQAEHSIEEVIRHLLSQYKVERDRCECEVIALLRKMADQNLVTIQLL